MGLKIEALMFFGLVQIGPRAGAAWKRESIWT